jgi:hypothetical protein
MALTLDGHAPMAQQNPSSSNTVVLTNSSANAIILVAAWINGQSVSTVTDNSGQGLTWARRSTAGTDPIEVWWVLAPVAFSGVTITVTYTGSAINAGYAWAVAGANTSSPFDSGGPVTAATGNAQITTANANTFIYTAARFAGTSSPTAGSGWTQTDSPATVGFALVEYQIVSSIQTNLVGNFTTGNNDQSGEIIDALVQAGATTVKARKTFSLIGTRVGSRQLRNT